MASASASCNLREARPVRPSVCLGGGHRYGGYIAAPDAHVSEEHMRTCSWTRARQHGEVRDVSLTRHAFFPGADGRFPRQQMTLVPLCLCPFFFPIYLFGVLFLYILFFFRDEIYVARSIIQNNKNRSKAVCYCVSNCSQAIAAFQILNPILSLWSGASKPVAGIFLQSGPSAQT